MLLLQGDCLELMKTLPDKSVDLFICDLPYGCLTNKPKKDGTEGKSKGGLKHTAKSGCAWDIKIDLDLFWKQVERLMKDDHTPIIHFCNALFGFELYNSNPNWFRYDLIWDKGFGVGFLNSNKMPLRSHENIYVFAKKGATYYRKDIEGIRCVKSVFQFANKKGKDNHPTQKPLDLYKFLIERYSKEGDTVLDPTAGSFTSGLACKELGREYIGIEMNQEFYEKALQRLE
jgi:site-specific DNA-methyltransferase (adenine-specific)